MIDVLGCYRKNTELRSLQEKKDCVHFPLQCKLKNSEGEGELFCKKCDFRFKFSVFQAEILITIQVAVLIPAQPLGSRPVVVMFS